MNNLLDGLDILVELVILACALYGIYSYIIYRKGYGLAQLSSMGLKDYVSKYPSTFVNRWKIFFLFVEPGAATTEEKKNLKNMMMFAWIIPLAAVLIFVLKAVVY